MDMGRQSGLMMSREKGYSVFMTSTGKFVRGRVLASHAQVGDEVEFSPVWFNGARPRTMGLVAGLVLALLVTSFSVYFTRPVIAAYVTIDINPSLELGVDKHDVVRSAAALNEDGSNLLESLKLIGKPVTEAVGEIMGLAEKDGYLEFDDESLVVITAVSVNGQEETNEALSQKIDQTVKESMGTQQGTIVTSLVATPQLRDEAQKQGISVGRLLMAQKAEEAGLHLDPVELKSSGLVQSIHSAGGDVQSLLTPKTGPDHDSLPNGDQKSQGNGHSTDDPLVSKDTGKNGDQKQEDDKSKTNGSEKNDDKSDKHQDENQGNGKKK